jgi:hypothetical protein
MGMILKWNLKVIGFETVDCNHPAQDGEKWQAVVNTVMNLRVLKKDGDILNN